MKPEDGQQSVSATRGYGLLENFLSQQRCRKANQLIPPHLREGVVLDIGCGNHPTFLLRSKFKKKVGMDRIQQSGEVSDVQMINFDLQSQKLFPFSDGEFSVVVMLAVVEHVKPECLAHCFREIYRILKSGGRLIITTPAAGTAPILSTLSFLKLLSSEEIDEHQELLRIEDVTAYLEKSGFTRDKIKSGFFEVFMNTWITADR